jgi:hypothetical protein
LIFPSKIFPCHGDRPRRGKKL